MDWTDDHGKLQGQFEITEQNTSSEGPPTITFNATLTGIESQGKITIKVTGTNQNGQWKGDATGTIDTTMLVLNGDALITYDPYFQNGVPTATVIFKPGSTKAVSAAIAKLAKAAARATRKP